MFNHFALLLLGAVFPFTELVGGFVVYYTCRKTTGKKVERKFVRFAS